MEAPGSGTINCSEPADLFLQKPSGKVNTTLNGSKRFSKCVSDLVVLVPFKIQHERLLEYVREIVYRCTNILEAKITLRTIVDRRLIVIDQKIIRRTVEDRILLGLATIVVDKDVAHDRIKPGLDIGTYAILLMIRQCPEHGLL